MGEPDAESGPYNLCKYKHFAPHAHAILRFFRAHKPTMALLSPAEPLSHSALCFYRGKIPWRFVSMPSIVLSVGATFCLLPQIVCWLRMTARLLRPISLPLRATVFCLRIAGEKRGILAEKWGRKQEKRPLFRCLLPCFPIATPPLLSRPVSFRPAPPTDGIDVVAELSSPLRIEQLPGRFALDTRRTRIIRGHIDRLLGEGKQKRPRSTKIDRGRELECADLAAGTAARRLSVCLCVCRKVR